MCLVPEQLQRQFNQACFPSTIIKSVASSNGVVEHRISFRRRAADDSRDVQTNEERRDRGQTPYERLNTSVLHVREQGTLRAQSIGRKYILSFASMRGVSSLVDCP